jgi:hypothetical protein
MSLGRCRPPRHPDVIGEVLSKPTAAAICSLLHHRRGHRVEYIVAQTGVSETTVVKHIGLLTDARVAEWTRSGSLRFRNGLRLDGHEFWAIEVKLTDWRRALYQAQRCRSFAHRVFVALPRPTVHAALDYFAGDAELKIGLIAIDPSGMPEVIHLPRKQKPWSRAAQFRALGISLREFAAGKS